MDKQDLRKKLILKRNQLSQQYRAIATQSIIQRTLDFISGYKNIASFISIQSELATHELNNAILQQNGAILLPKVDGQTLKFVQQTNLHELQKASIGKVWEPIAAAPIITPDLIIVPALGCDAKGNRLGYGHGYYDRALHALPDVPTLLPIFAELILDHIQSSDYDIAIDTIITEDGIIHTKTRNIRNLKR